MHTASMFFFFLRQGGYALVFSGLGLKKRKKSEKKKYPSRFFPFGSLGHSGL